MRKATNILGFWITFGAVLYQQWFIVQLLFPNITIEQYIKGVFL